jgi:hypothetical protein
MNKYKVKVTHLFSEVIDIEAENEDEAKEKVKIVLQQEDRNAMPSYETTLPSEHWPVITEEKYNEMVKDVEAKLAEQKEPSNIITP